MDPSEMTCEELWEFITARDPANDPLEVASAIALWNDNCANTFGPWPQSGGTIPPRPPHA